MAIQNGADTLKQRILDALTETTLKDGNINIDDEGNVTKSDQSPALKHPDAVPNIKITAGKPAHMLFQNAYESSDQVGIDVLIEIIVKEVLNYLQQNIEIVMKTRMDTLEDAYNLMVTAMASTGAGMTAPPLTPVGAAFTAIAAAGQGTVATPRATTITAPLRAAEAAQQSDIK